MEITFNLDKFQILTSKSSRANLKTILNWDGIVFDGKELLEIRKSMLNENFDTNLDFTEQRKKLVKSNFTNKKETHENLILDLLNPQILSFKISESIGLQLNNKSQDILKEVVQKLSMNEKIMEKKKKLEKLKLINESKE